MPTKKWDAEVEGLIARFRALEPASEPFQLTPWAKVVDPVRYHAFLAMEIEWGPTGPRARLGSFQAELKAYLGARGK